MARPSGAKRTMNLQQLISERRTVHDYRPGPLPDGALERAITAATAAPNHRLTEPWRFVHVGPETRRVLLELSIELKGGAQSLGEGGVQRLEAKLLGPSTLLVVCQVRHDDPDVDNENYAAVACAIHSAMLSFWAEGIGSKWSTGQLTTAARTYEALGVDEHTDRIVALLWVGYPSRAGQQKPRRRRSLAEVFREVP